MMEEEDILDDLYKLEAPSYQKLRSMEEIQEPLLWAAPAQLKGKPLLFLLGGISLAVIMFTLTFSLESHLSFWTVLFCAMLSIGIGLGSIFATLLWGITRKIKQQTHYGISQTAIWVKPYNKPVQKYPLDSLGKLKVSPEKISSITIENSTYQEQVLLKNIPDAPAVYELLVELQKENKQEA